MKSYVFPVALERDEDVWRACVPQLESRGGSTWAHTKEEALQNIQEVVQIMVEELLEDGEPLPQGVRVADEPAVAVNVG